MFLNGGRPQWAAKTAHEQPARFHIENHDAIRPSSAVAAMETIDPTARDPRLERRA
jgi:hypothetical protein